MFNLFWKPIYSKLQKYCLIWIPVQTVFFCACQIWTRYDHCESLRIGLAPLYRSYWYRSCYLNKHLNFLNLKIIRNNVFRGGWINILYLFDSKSMSHSNQKRKEKFLFATTVIAKTFSMKWKTSVFWGEAWMFDFEYSLKLKMVIHIFIQQPETNCSLLSCIWTCIDFSLCKLLKQNVVLYRCCLILVHHKGKESIPKLENLHAFH